jgi:maltose alpha-D-glucosyltransferase/alpha-amylase
VSEVIAHYLHLVQLLAQRTAEMHLALATEPEDPAFAPEPFTELRQRSLYQAARTRLNQTFKMLRRRGALDRISDDLREETRAMLGRQAEIDARLRGIVAEKIDATRIRVHGDYHLGQVLYTGKDFVIIDFEGEPARPIGERRFKRSPLLDVAGMLRSFHYATVSALHHGGVRPEDRQALGPWAHLWHRWVSASYLGTYLEAAQGSIFITPDEDQLSVMLDFYMLDKCIYELGYEINNRPDWLGIPLRGLSDLLGEEG